MTAQRVAILLGGRSNEHKVSVQSARSVLAALDRERWDPVPIAISQQGAWFTVAETTAALAENSNAFPSGGRRLSIGVLSDLESCEIAFPLVHGTYGEDGTLQGLLEMVGIPYTGCGVTASAIGMDKALMKALFQEARIPVARFEVIRSWDYTGNQFDVSYVHEAVGFPCFVKPANGGSSVGVSKALSIEDLPAAFSAAFVHDDKILVEQAIEGREVECSVLGNESPEASVVGEIIPDREFYDYDSKYSESSLSALKIPAELDRSTADEVRNLAIRTYSEIGRAHV